MPLYRFDPYTLDTADRQLRRDSAPVEVTARYFDALVLLVSEAGALVTKDRFMAEVWRGVPVTDEALTQCIRTLRRVLGDDAASPRFIETVPKHGYRFVASVEQRTDEDRIGPLPPPSPRSPLLIGVAGLLGAGVAGIVGGLIYGSAASAHPGDGGTGSMSALLVVTVVTLAAAAMGGAGVTFAIGAAQRWRGSGPWLVAGGAVGGLLVGGIVKLLGVDAFNLLLGRAPSEITGGYEGLLLGAAVGAAAWVAGIGTGAPRLRFGTTAATAIGGAAGLLISLTGGRLMGGSLDQLAHRFPASRLRVDSLGGLVGEDRFGPVTATLTATLEGALFAACVVAAMVLTRRERPRR